MTRPQRHAPGEIQKAEFRIAGDDRVIATAETIYVLVDADTLKKTPVPDALRSAFAHGTRGQVTDHAGLGR
jgi:acyl-CoA thioester hydrolase